MSPRRRCSRAREQRACRSGPICSAGSSTAWAGPPTAGRRSCRRPSATSTACRSTRRARASVRVHRDGHLGDRRAAHARPRPEAPGLLGLRPAWPRARDADRRRARASAVRRGLRRGLRRDRRDRREAAFLRTRFAEDAALERSVVFINRAEDPAAERLTCPRAALTAADTSRSSAACTSSSSSST